VPAMIIAPLRPFSGAGLAGKPPLATAQPSVGGRCQEFYPLCALSKGFTQTISGESINTPPCRKTKPIEDKPKNPKTKLATTNDQRIRHIQAVNSKRVVMPTNPPNISIEMRVRYPLAVPPISK